MNRNKKVLVWRTIIVFNVTQKMIIIGFSSMFAHNKSYSISTLFTVQQAKVVFTCKHISSFLLCPQNGGVALQLPELVRMVELIYYQIQEAVQQGVNESAVGNTNGRHTVLVFAAESLMDGSSSILTPKLTGATCFPILVFFLLSWSQKLQLSELRRLV